MNTSPQSRPAARRRRRAFTAVACASLVSLALARGAAADDEGKGESRSESPPAPVELDSLLRLPTDIQPMGPPSAGGLTRERWQERFTAARADVSHAEESLAEAQRQLEEIASDSEAWQLAAPGAAKTAENSPLSYKLRQDIRRSREEVERTRRELQELETEASLAGVPEEWRAPPPRQQDAAPGDK